MAIAKYLVLLCELLLIAALVQMFQIEGHRHFFPVACLMIGGFAVNAWLPMQHRIAFFSALSIAGLLFVLGVVNGTLVLSIGGGLIAICYLKIGLRLRLGLLIATGMALVLARAWFPLPIWPVLGSMFMFRLILFVYDTRRETDMPTLASSLAYFFMLPNVCFPLFPVVDYKSFRTTWYDGDEWDIYQRGVTWIVRGLVHLMLYRYIRSNLVPNADALVDVQHMALFMCTNYALYLQISGQFHLITGLLHLFGFNLPRTHHLFFLASSFSDIWRRINIYWKDFLAKLFFFPMFFALRRRDVPVGQSIVFSVLLVFVCTWLLHSWQTFWLLGKFPLTANDACLWLGVGICVAVNAALDRRRRAEHERNSWFAALSLSLRTICMFSLVSLFWACWTRPGFLYLLASAMNRQGAANELLIVFAWMLSAVAIGMWMVLLIQGKLALQRKRPSELKFTDSAKLHLAGLAVATVLASSWTSSLFDASYTQTIASLKTDPADAVDADNRLQSYYEDLNSATIQAGPLLSSFSPGAETRRAQALGFYKISRTADAYQGVELIPNVKTELDGSPFSVNRYGMRDRETVQRSKPPGTSRIALVGSSIVMGYGVSDEEVFSRLFESRLNGEYGNSSKHFEVLNFGVGKQWAPHRLNKIQWQVVGFAPDLLYYFAHQDEFQEVASQPAQLIDRKLELPSQHLKDVAARAGVAPGMAPGAIYSRLQMVESELLAAYYQTMVDECRSRQIVPVWIYLPIPSKEPDAIKAKLIPIASKTGFIVCDLSAWHQEHEGLFPTAEYHPNAKGHQLITDALMFMVQSRPETLRRN